MPVLFNAEPPRIRLLDHSPVHQQLEEVLRAAARRGGGGRLVSDAPRVVRAGGCEMLRRACHRRISLLPAASFPRVLAILLRVPLVLLLPLLLLIRLAYEYQWLWF